MGSCVIGTGFPKRFARRWLTSCLLGVVAIIGLVPLAGSCGAFNPAFVELLDPESAGTFATLDNAPGHVVLQFINNAEVDERLVSYLESAEGGGLVLTPAEKRALRPRVRLRVLVTFANGIQNAIEFVDGSARLIDSEFDATAFPDLNQNDLDNSVVLCDVARVEILPGSAIEVFIPVELRVWELVEVNTGNDNEIPQVQFVPRDRIPPQFRVLQPDQVDEDGNVVLQSNIGIRDFPAPVVDPICGSVIAIIMNGNLRVPFLTGVDGNPSFDQDDDDSVAAIGGRYEFTVSVQ